MDFSAINWEAVKLIVQLLYFVASIGIGIYGWQATRHRVTLKRIESLERATDGKFVNHDIRLTCLENDLKHTPTNADIATLNTQISKTNGLMQHLAGRLTGINRAVDLINEYLINRGDKQSG